MLVSKKWCRNDPLKTAIISDIHSNLEAFETVLRDVEAQKVDRIYCLGDVVGYGPDSLECIDLVIQHCDLVILGNHDKAALVNPEGFPTSAERAIFWTRQVLESSSIHRMDFLEKLPRQFQEGKLLYVHGSARNPLNEFVFPEDIHNERKIERIFALVGKYCFQGHTHIPGIFTHDHRFFRPEEVEFEYDLCDEKTMINVGAVGQPHDRNPDACYVILEDNHITFRRIKYDVEVTIKKVYAIPELDNFIGDRLRDGR